MHANGKSQTESLVGLLQPMPLAEGPWTSIGIEFVDALPLTKHGNSRLMVVVDRFTKAVHSIPTHLRLTAEECARLCINKYIGCMASLMILCQIEIHCSPVSSSLSSSAC
jgi:hypothetical protein